MKIAVVTPYYSESIDVLVRCKKSVSNQTYDCRHIFVADGRPNDWLSTWKDSDHIVLSTSHADAGATPRAIGAISAFSQGYDAVSFLDADNTYGPSHIETMVKIAKQNNCDVVSATRNIVSKFNNEFLYVDTIESNGTDFCDTNCLFLTSRLLHIMTGWITDKNQALAGDRIFWNLIASNSNIKRSHSSTPTVNYYTKWAWHFQQANVTIPDDSIWMKQDSSGKVTVHKHKEQK